MNKPNEIGKVNNWKAPIWHSDFGDPVKELSMLKELCSHVWKINNDFQFELDCYEEGYMSVNILTNKSPYLVLQIVDISENKIGLFFKDGKEYYIYRIKEIEKYINL